MKRTTAPGSSSGSYVDDNPALGVVGTLLIAEDRNAIQEELINAIEESGQTPSGADLEQLLKAIKILGVPAGTIASFAGANAPTNWLKCDGSAVSRTLYAALFSAIGTTWGVGDGSTTFNLPDLRGAALSGVGTSTGYTQNETIALGTKYNDQMQGHGHDTTAYSGSGGSSRGWPRTTTGNPADGSAGEMDEINAPKAYGGNGTPRVGNVTRGKRVGVNYIIKY